MTIQNPEQAVSILDKALQFQRYRRIATESIQPSEEIRLPTSVSADIDAAFQALSSEPNWIEIGRQLALLKVSKAFNGVYLRRDELDIEIVVVHWWGGGPLNLTSIETQRDAVWDILRSLRPIIRKFELDPNLKDNITKIIEQIEPNEDSQTRAYKIVVSILKAALIFANSKQGPTGLLLNLALGGLTNELQNAITDPLRLRKRDVTFSWIEPTLTVVAWDVPAEKVIGHTYRNSLNLSQLERNIKYILSQ